MDILLTWSLLLAAGVILLTYHFTYWKRKGLNSLGSTLLLGHTAKFLMGKLCLGVLFQDFYSEMKQQGWKAGGCFYAGRPVYMPVDQHLVKSVMISDFWTFPNHGLYINQIADPLSGHIFNMEGYRWKNLRAKIPSAFTAAKMRRNVFVMEKIGREFVAKLMSQTSKNTSLNIKEELTRFTIDVFTACAFSMESNTLKGKNADLVKHSRPFFDQQWSRTSITLAVLIPRLILSRFGFKLFPLETTSYFMNMFAKIKDYREKNDKKENDLTDLLINLCDRTKGHSDFNGKDKMDLLTFNEFAAQMFIFFEGGFETSSNTQTFALYELAANPEIQNRLREEIDTVLKKFDGKIGYDSINEMEYLSRVVDETLRKYPILPLLPRESSKKYRIPGTDITLEKDTMVIISSLGIHHDPEFYPDPMKFDPDRFTPENKAKRPHCSYLPFGEGPRICPGKRFGIWQTKMGLLLIIKNFKVTLSEKMQLPLTFDTPGLLLKVKGDVWLNIEKVC